MAAKWLKRFALPLLICIYLFVRFWGLSDTCLWFDEIFSVHAAEHSWGGILDFVALDLVHPPLFYVFLKLWITVGGESLSWLRLLSELFSAAALIPFLLICRQLKLDGFAAAVAMLFFAVNGPLIKYSGEVRMYSLLLLLSLTSVWLFFRSAKSGNGWGWLTAVNVLLVYTHYFGWLTVISEITVVSIYYRSQLRNIVTSAAVSLAAFVPWLSAVFVALRSSAMIDQNIGWMTRPGFDDAAAFMLELVQPFYYSLTSDDARSIYLISVPLLAIAAAVLILGRKARTIGADYVGSYPALLTFAAVPAATAFAASWLSPFSIWGTRHLIIVFPPVFILMGASMSAMASTRLRATAVTAIVLLIACAAALQVQRPQRQSAWCGWNELVRSERNADKSLAVFTFEDLAAYDVWFETRHQTDRPAVGKLTGISAVAEDRAYFLPRGFDEIKTVRLDDISPEKFLLFYRAKQFDEDGPPISEVKAAGYEITDRSAYDAGVETAFRLKFQKKTVADPTREPQP